MLNQKTKMLLCALCVAQVAAILSLDLPAWALIAMMIAPAVLLVDCIVTIAKMRRAE